MSGRAFWGLLLILVGAAFLAANFGGLPWGVWATTLRAWPVLLVLWGVSVLMRPLGRAGAVITAVLALVAAGGIIAYGYAYGPASGAATGEYALSEPLDPATKTVDLHLAYGAGVLKVDGQAGQAELVAGTLTYVGPKPVVRYSKAGDRAELSLSRGHEPWVFSQVSHAPGWIVHLNPQPTYAMDLDLGASNIDLDLSALKVARLNLSFGASSARITFGAQGFDTTGDINAGAASVKVRVPRSVGVRVKLSSALAGSNLRSLGFERPGGWWVSPGYAEKASHLDLTVNAGLSSFDLEWTD